MSDRYIEVTGSDSFRERPVESWAILSINVLNSRKGSATHDVERLRSLCVKALLDAGVAQADITDDGGRVSRNWWNPKRHEQTETVRSLRVTRDDLAPVYIALESLEPAFEDDRFNLEMSTGRVCRADEDDEAEALARALKRARAKAERMASAEGVRIASLINVTQTGKKTQVPWELSGAGISEMAAGPSENIEESSRTIEISCRARFAVE